MIPEPIFCRMVAKDHDEDSWRVVPMMVFLVLMAITLLFIVSYLISPYNIGL